VKDSSRTQTLLRHDEPLAALDLKLRRSMQLELKSIQREVGITFLFVTHDQDEALSMSDRVAIMNDGVIEQCGTPEDVYENPTSVFAASFIGTSNLMQGTYAAGSIRVAPELVVPVPGHTGSADGDRLSVAIRPEKIWMSDFAPSMVQVPGTIVSTSYHGATTQYLVSVAAVPNETVRTKTQEYTTQQGLVFPVLADAEMKLNDIFLVVSTPTMVIVRPESSQTDVNTRASRILRSA